MRANRMRSSLRMSVKAKSSSRARPASKEGEIIGGSTVTQSLHLPPRPLRAPNNAEEEAKTSTSRYTLRPPIILFIQHNEFICLEGSQLMSRAKRGETFSRRFFLSFLLWYFPSASAPSGVYNHLLAAGISSRERSRWKTRAYKNSWRNLYGAERCVGGRRCYYIKLTTKHIYVCLGITRREQV